MNAIMSSMPAIERVLIGHGSQHYRRHVQIPKRAVGIVADVRVLYQFLVPPVEVDRALVPVVVTVSPRQEAVGPDHIPEGHCL